jgi:murein DD-endopeptidase MepM/ murein hydrolase activator NlpD
MERYSLIVVADETAPIRRFDVRKDSVRRALQIGAVLVVAVLLGLVDYVRVRIDHVELERLRSEAAEQQAKMEAFDEAVAGVEAALGRVREFERKVRTIANLPGSAAAGGDDVVEAGPGSGADLSGLAGGGVDVERVPGPTAEEPQGAPHRAAGKASAGAADDRISQLRGEAQRLGFVAKQRQLSLEELVTQLEDKHDRLASSPAVWPTQGWLTSRFGKRISPFTGKRQFHAGIDIAGAPATDVLATARGRVVFAGKKGPMGNTLIIDHGYGVRTHYGHNDKLHVKRGQRVERGDVVATLGNSGRSTGPHLHYTVEVKGKAVNPLDYIFD